ncbi:MAG: restriction endonuclease subunit S [Bacillaceae bacterium]|nr:restriction endonuclease subunit S [Bacillaceae bacterium]
MRDKPTEFNGDIPWIRIEDVDGMYIYDSKTEQRVSAELVSNMNLKVFPKGTVLCTCSCSMGATAIVGKPLISNQTFIGIVPGKELYSEFLYYLMQANSERLQFNAQGAIQQYLSRHDFEHLKVAVPPLKQQIEIAQFLIEKLSEIDSLIADKEKLIDLLEEKRQAIITEAVTKGLNPNVKMKDSGVEWIGEIPEHWQVTKLKYKGNVKGRIGFRGYTTEDLVLEGDGALTLGATNIDKFNELDLSERTYISWEKYYESPEIIVKVGDLIVVQRGSIGKFCIIEKEIANATINPSLLLIKDYSENNKFLYWFLNSKCIKNYITSLTSSTAVPMISQEQLKNLRIVLPPIREQKEIVNKLDIITSEFYETMNLIRKQINKLKEYRQSLIYEAVTGKIDVREYKKVLS